MKRDVDSDLVLISNFDQGIGGIVGLAELAAFICSEPQSSLPPVILNPSYLTLNSLQAAAMALERGWSINLGGGMHHACFEVSLRCCSMSVTHDDDTLDPDPDPDLVAPGSAQAQTQRMLPQPSSGNLKPFFLSPLSVIKSQTTIEPISVANDMSP